MRPGATLTVGDYNRAMHPTRGFLPVDDPLPHLPAAFDAWEQLAAELPALTAAQRVRWAVEQLPPFPLAALDTARAEWRAKVLLAHVANCYIWTEPPVPAMLPARIAVPWHTVATRLGMPPMLTYADWTLNRWRRLDANGPIAVGNLALTLACGAGMDESWFALIHVSIEALAGPGLAALPVMQIAAANADSAALEVHLKTLAQALDAMLAMLDRMRERCDPYIYYQRVRPFMFGWRNNPALPGGLIYENVAEYRGAPMQFYGETGAQSTVIPAIDAALGIAHEHDEMRDYLRAMLDYVPPAHRVFVEALERGPSVRGFAASSTAAVRDAYNACVERVEHFRAQHLQLAADYIYKQNKDAALGTGGTSFMTYLGKHHAETRAAKLLPG